MQNWNPYTAGDIVRDKAFYGRSYLLTKVLSQTTPVTYIIGMRRIGKTSVLRKLETQEIVFSIDLQRIGKSWKKFKKYLKRAINRKRKTEPWLPSDKDITKVGNIFDLIEILDESACSKYKNVWLLIDEAEILIAMGKENYTRLQQFRSVISHLQCVRVVFASAKGLIEIDELASTQNNGSPFLNNFPPPIYIAGLKDEAAANLVRQTQTLSTPLPVPDNILETICRAANNHPYLIQWTCYHLYEKSSNPVHWQLDKEIFNPQGHLRKTLKDDFKYLSQTERRIMRAILRGQPPSAQHLNDYLPGLLKQGYLKKEGETYQIGNEFFKNLLHELEEIEWRESNRISEESTLRLYRNTETKEKKMDPQSAAIATATLIEGIKFLYGQAEETLKEWRQKRQSAKPPVPPDENVIDTPDALQNKINTRLASLQEQSQNATAKMQIKEVEALLKQIQSLHQNKLDYETELTNLPGVDDRIAIRRRIANIEEDIARKAEKMRQTLQKLSGQTIYVPALDA